MKEALPLLEKHPEIGMAGASFAAILGFTDITEVLKLSGMAVGITVGLVTLYIKGLQAIRETREFKKSNSTKDGRRK